MPSARERMAKLGNAERSNQQDAERYGYPRVAAQQDVYLALGHCWLLVNLRPHLQRDDRFCTPNPAHVHRPQIAKRTRPPPARRDSQPHDYPEALSTPPMSPTPAARALFPAPSTPPYHRGYPLAVGHHSSSPLPVRHWRLLPAYPLTYSPARAYARYARPRRIGSEWRAAGPHTVPPSPVARLLVQPVIIRISRQGWLMRVQLPSFIRSPPCDVQHSTFSQCHLAVHAPMHPYPLHPPTIRLLQQRPGSVSRFRRSRAPRSRSIFRVRFSFRLWPSLSHSAPPILSRPP
jgi:hypothetical protein